MTLEDLGTLKVHPGLLTYVVAQTADGRCARLNLYREIAQNVLDSLQKIDRLSPRSVYLSVQTFAETQSLKETITALLIRKKDFELQGMLKNENLEDKIETISLLYARLVIGHETDQNCDRIVAELIEANFPVRAGTCS